MARYVLPIAGAVIGSFVPGLGPQLGFAIGSILGNIVDPQVIKGPSIGDGQTTTTQEGQPRPIVWGAGVVGANIIDRGELKKSTKRTRQSKGGPVTEEERLHLTYAMRICEGPIQGVLRVWEDEKLVYDVRDGDQSQVSSEDNANYAKQFRLYLGTEEQMPDSALEALHGVGNTPAYRGTAYVVFESKDVTDRRGSIPNYRFEVLAGGGSITTLGSFVFSEYQAAENDDGFDFQANSETIAYPSGSQRVIATRDGKFILSSAGSGVVGSVYARNETTGQYSYLGTFADVIEDWVPSGFGGGGYYFDIDKDGKTIVASLMHTGVGAYNYLYVIKYDAASGTFRLADHASDVPYNSGVSVCVAIEPFGHWVVIGSRSPTGFHRYFITDDGVLFDYRFIALAPLNNWPTHLIIPYGVYSPAYTVLAFRANQWVAQVYVGPTADTTPIITARDLAVDFPDTDFNNNFSNYMLRPYYSESDAGWPKLVMFANGPSSPGTDGYRYRICSYEIRSSIPTPPIQSLFPTLELEGPAHSGEFAVAVGGWGKDLTAISGRNTYAPADVAASSVRFYRFVHDNETDTFYLDKHQDVVYSDTSIDSQDYMQTRVGSTSSGNSGDGISYRWFVEDVCDRSGLPDAKVEASELQDYTIRGVVAAQQYSGGEIIRSTQPVFPIDVSDYDRKIHFTKRGKPAVAAITIDDMVDETYDFTRKDAQSYPRKLNLIYQHQKSGYVSAKATVERISPDVRVSGESSTTVPVVMDETKAIQAADILLKVSWTDAEGDISFSVPAEFDYLTVGDCVAVYPRSGQQYRMRIESIERTDGRLDIKGKVDRQTSYGSTVTALPVPDPTPPPPTTVGPTRLAYMDIPALTDADDVLCYYVAVNGMSMAWYGAATERRIDPDEFSEVARSGLGQAVGTLLETLGSGPVDYSDTYNSLVLYMPGGETNAPQAVSNEQLLREQNVVAVCRADGSAELLQFRDVEDLGEDRYRLSYLLRGRLYTGASEHDAGATVVILSYGASRVQVDASNLWATWDHRAVSFGDDPDTAPIRTDTYAARSQIEFPVGLLAASVAGTDLNVSWSHAFRFGSDVTPVDSVNRTGYTVEASDGTNTASLTMLPGDQAATLDITGWTGTATVTVRGLNRFTGPGLPSTTTAAI